MTKILRLFAYGSFCLLSLAKADVGIPTRAERESLLRKAILYTGKSPKRGIKIEITFSDKSKWEAFLAKNPLQKIDELFEAVVYTDDRFNLQAEAVIKLDEKDIESGNFENLCVQYFRDLKAKSVNSMILYTDHSDKVVPMTRIDKEAGYTWLPMDMVESPRRNIIVGVSRYLNKEVSLDLEDVDDIADRVLEKRYDKATHEHVRLYFVKDDEMKKQFLFLHPPQKPNDKVDVPLLLNLKSGDFILSERLLSDPALKNEKLLPLITEALTPKPKAVLISYTRANGTKVAPENVTKIDDPWVSEGWSEISTPGREIFVRSLHNIPGVVNLDAIDQAFSDKVRGAQKKEAENIRLSFVDKPYLSTLYGITGDGDTHFADGDLFIDSTLLKRNPEVFDTMLRQFYSLQERSLETFCMEPDDFSLAQTTPYCVSGDNHYKVAKPRKTFVYGDEHSFDKEGGVHYFYVVDKLGKHNEKVRLDILVSFNCRTNINLSYFDRRIRALYAKNQLHPDALEGIHEISILPKDTIEFRGLGENVATASDLSGINIGDMGRHMSAESTLFVREEVFQEKAPPELLGSFRSGFIKFFSQSEKGRKKEQIKELKQKFPEAAKKLIQENPEDSADGSDVDSEDDVQFPFYGP